MMPDTIADVLQQALDHHQAGRLAEAETLYRQVLAQVPDHPEALHRLGVLAGQCGQPDVAIDLISLAVALDPSVAVYHNDLGESYRRVGKLDLAIASFQRASELGPDIALVQNNLGDALKAVGRHAEAIAAHQRALALAPDDAEGQCRLGVELQRAGRTAEAIAAYRRAIDIQGDHAVAYRNLAVALNEAGRTAEGIEACRRAIALRGDDPLAYNNLGGMLQELGRFDEAIAACRRAIELKPDHAKAHNNLGAALQATGSTDRAITAFRQALALQPGYPEAHNNLATSLGEQGRIDEALQEYRRSLELRPDYSKAADNLLCCLLYHPDKDAQAILAEHRRWARQFADPLAGEITPHPNDRSPERKLRVGFVSPDFRDHPVGQLLVPLLTHRDRRRAEFLAYSDARAPDAITRKLKALTDHWQNIVGQSDVQVAGRIRGDRIDILVDLALHTAGNRLLVFARKPAPVQVTMLGLPATTGLSTIDYRLTDPYLDPPGTTDADYSEHSIRLPHCYWIYRPPDAAVPVGPLPAEQNGFVTFGCLNQFHKISRPAFELWVEILRAVPAARLLILAKPGSQRDDVRALFETGRVSGDRIEFVARTSRLDYLRRFGGIDIGLDPFPYNGHTSTLDALWMGVPIVTLAGRTAVARGGVSILSNVGLPELIARTPEAYVEISVGLARDLPRMARLRGELRGRMLSSPLVDAPAFAADVEAALRRMWHAWCARR
jgi:predicted O-linked N-acetylglucosamine transferase (SPINDLY family)